jgi:SAM-dependent methyltransferase
MSEKIKWVGGDGRAHSGKVVDRVNGFDIIDCVECGFRHATPIPTEHDLEEVYSHEYYQTEKPFYIEHYIEDKEWWDIVYTDRYEILEDNLPSSRRNLLDIGSGPGLFLNLGKGRGWQVKGIEPSSEAAAYSKEILKLDIEEVFFDETSVKKLGKFDAINMGEVLEHLPDPKAILDLAHRTLNEDGLICLIVPNDFNPFQELLRESVDFKPWWIAPPHHINFFNQKSLTSLVESCGFEVVHKETTFPIDMFLMMGENYIDDGDLGRKCHGLRKQFEINLSKSADKKLWRKLYSGFASAGVGREIVMIARKL